MRAKAPPIGPVTKSGAIRFWIGMAILAALVGTAAWASTRRLHWEQTASGVKYRVVTAGEGPNAAPTDIASITYTGRLADGSVFDSNEGREPAELPVTGFVPGFSEALQLMNKGATYELRIPPALAYGERGTPGGPIPPNATLDFTVTLNDIRALSAEERQQMQAMEQMQREQMEEQIRQLQQGGAGAPPGDAAPRPEGGAGRPRGR
jgi:hypothetical protein